MRWRMRMRITRCLMMTKNLNKGTQCTSLFCLVVKNRLILKQEGRENRI